MGQLPRRVQPTEHLVELKHSSEVSEEPGLEVSELAGADSLGQGFELAWSCFLKKTDGLIHLGFLIACESSDLIIGDGHVVLRGCVLVSLLIDDLLLVGDIALGGIDLSLEGDHADEELFVLILEGVLLAS